MRCYKIFTFYILIPFLFFFISCSHKDIYEANEVNFSAYFEACGKAFKTLDAVANDYKFDVVSLDSLRETSRLARLSYKRIEFYIAYQFPEFANSNFNGAPLLQLEKDGSSSKILAPNGLQVLDELVFSEDAKENKTKIAAIAKRINSQFAILGNGVVPININNDDLILAARMQLVRIFTLGITGFDTPGSANGLEESEISLAAMWQILNANTQSLHNNTTLDDVNLLFEKAVTNLKKQNSFEDFDRLYFLKEYIDPLYKKLFYLQKNRTDFDISKRSAWNPQSTSIFAANFLNPYFFTELTKEEDNESLRKLGEALFYDTAISANKSISCATCHNPDKAFTDNEVKSLSIVQNETVLRNAPTLLNAVYADRFFYDVRAFSLEQQVEHVIFNEKEFNTGYVEIINKLKKNPKYVADFTNNFGKDGIDRKAISRALASYVLSLQSFNSEFDKYVRNENDNVSISVKNGFNLFMGKANCATCHFAPTFSGLVPPFYGDSETEILGVLENPNASVKKLDSDEGRFKNGITLENAWIYEKSFKTTTVRNIALTAPYFHNGAYNTLEEVVDFYNKGGGAGMGLEVKNQTLPEAELNLTESEISDLISFMKSLSDTSASIKNIR